jgi:hypothetical protein
MQHPTLEELEARLDWIRNSPTNDGIVELIVRRPQVDGREVLEEGELDLTVGLVGDTWSVRPSSRTPDGSPHPEKQLNIMNSRAIALIAGEQERWQLAGDQLYIDLDLSDENLPPGTRLAIGTATIEVTALPHTGCQKFKARFGIDAMKFVNSPVGTALHLRGINAKVVRPGRVRVGDTATKIEGEER